MDQEEVEVVQPQVGEGLAQRLVASRVVALPDMVRLEEFADDEEVGALDRALGEDLGQRLADLLLVAVARGAVDQAVARPDRRLDRRADFAWRRCLERAEPEGGHGHARAERDAPLRGRCRRHGVGGWRVAGALLPTRRRSRLLLRPCSAQDARSAPCLVLCVRRSR